MPLYFFDFDGFVDEWDELELKDDAEARRQAILSLSSILHEVQSERPDLDASVCCEIRNMDGDIVGMFSAAMRPGQEYFELQQIFDYPAMC